MFTSTAGLVKNGASVILLVSYNYITVVAKRETMTCPVNHLHSDVNKYQRCNMQKELNVHFNTHTCMKIRKYLIITAD